MTPAHASTDTTDALLVRLAYELLDAHDDTARLADGLETDLRWAAHLDYLRGLQRVGRELLAQAVAEQDEPTRAHRRGR